LSLASSSRVRSSRIKYRSASYGAASLAHASGLLAVYVSALVLGNARLPHGPAIRGFAEGMARLAQIGLFVMLGLLAFPPALARSDLACRCRRVGTRAGGPARGRHGVNGAPTGALAHRLPSL
jgi:hypothetical protein